MGELRAGGAAGERESRDGGVREAMGKGLVSTEVGSFGCSILTSSTW